MRMTGMLFGLTLTAFIGASAHAGAILTDPDAVTIFLLQYKMAKTAPPYLEMAQSVHPVKAANEFQKPEAIKQADATLRALAVRLQDTGTIEIHMSSHFSDYDADSGEYDFDLNDGTYIPCSAFGRRIQVALTNGTQAQAWKLPPHDAEAALRKNRGDRLATLVLTLALLDSPPSVEGQPLILNTRIIRYEVATSVGNVRLGAMTVATAP